MARVPLIELGFVISAFISGACQGTPKPLDVQASAAPVGVVSQELTDALERACGDASRSFNQTHEAQLPYEAERICGEVTISHASKYGLHTIYDFRAIMPSTGLSHAVQVGWNVESSAADALNLGPVWGNYRKILAEEISK